MKKIAAIVCLLMVLSCQQDSPLQKRINQIDKLLIIYSAQDLFSGVILVSSGDDIIYHKAFGWANREWRVKMIPQAKFKIGSLSKSFTAMLVLQLAEQGYLDLDSIIGNYLPDYNGPGKKRITIKQLLNHTSGISGGLPAEQEKISERQFHTLEDLMHYAEREPLAFEPGSAFIYSNLGYSLLALICQRVTQQPFPLLLQKRIFEPAGMRDTKNDLDALPEERLASGYEYDLLDGYQNSSFIDNSYAAGYGAISASATDLYKWSRVLDACKLISAETKKTMYSPAAPADYACGWFIRKQPFGPGRDSLVLMEHSGSINGFGSYIARVPGDSLCVIVLKNSRSHNYIRPVFAPSLGKSILSILYDETFQLPKKSISMYMARILGNSGIEKARDEYKRLQKDSLQQYEFSEQELNKLGVELLFKYRCMDDARAIFGLNLQQFSLSYNVYDSYAYTLMQMADYQQAIIYYQKGLQVLEEYPAQRNPVIEKDAARAIQYIKEMQEKVRN